MKARYIDFLTWLKWCRQQTHLQKKINSVHENYFYRNQLDPSSSKHNATRFAAVKKLEYLAIMSGKNKSCTMNFDYSWNTKW